MKQYRPPVLLALPMMLAAAHGVTANEPAETAISADPMYMAVYSPEKRVASTDVHRALPADLPVANGPGADDLEDFALNDPRGSNPFQRGGAGD